MHLAETSGERKAVVQKESPSRVVGGYTGIVLKE